MNESTDELQQMILQLHRQGQNVGLKMNMKKIWMMLNNYLLSHEIKIDDEVIECVHKYINWRQKIGACQIMKKKSKEKLICDGVLLLDNTMLRKVICHYHWKERYIISAFF